MSVTDAALAPSRPVGLELLGVQAGSGHREAPALVRRQDGQTLQLTPLLYRVLEAIDGQRTPSEIAAIVSEQGDRPLTPEGVEFLVREKLEPLGLIGVGDDAPEIAGHSDPLFA